MYVNPNFNVLQYRMPGNILRKNIKTITTDFNGAMSQVQVQYALTHILKEES